jgi:hypothetical protein
MTCCILVDFVTYLCEQAEEVIVLLFKVEVKFVCKQTVCLHYELLYFQKYDVLSEYLGPFWFAMILNEYEIEFIFRKIRSIRNLGNVYIQGSSHCYVQNRCAERT